jgi:hypothetical protein
VVVEWARFQQLEKLDVFFDVATRQWYVKKRYAWRAGLKHIVSGLWQDSIEVSGIGKYAKGT